MASAQLSNLDEAGKRFAADFKRLEPRPAIVNVADFSSTENILFPQAHYLAWYLSNSLEVRGKNFLKVPDHSEFDKTLTRITHSSQANLSAADIPGIRPEIGGDFLIVGTLKRNSSTFEVKLAAVCVSDGSLIDSGTVEVRSSEFLESLSMPLQSSTGQALNHAGVNGIGMPHCTFTPDPAYTEMARARNLNGVVLMDALISAQGKIERLKLIRMVGFGLDEQAYNTVKTWKCKPARDRKGNPVDVEVPIEVTFRLN